MESNGSESCINNEESHGILNMDNAKGLGDESSRRQSTKISKKLMTERNKAIKMLQGIKDLRPGKRASDITSTPETTGLERTEYVIPHVPCNTTNISDLVVENTINLNTSSIPGGDSNTVSFEPSEITGRSTLCKPINKTMSTLQILASSFSEEVRNLEKVILNSRASVGSLPKTADLSRNTDSQVSAVANSTDNLGLSFNNLPQDNEIVDENFIPADNLGSRLAADEREWEMEFATIPFKNMRTPMRDELPVSPKNGSEGLTYSTLDDNLSIGAFFNKRSEDLYKIIPDNSSPIKHKPVPLIDDSSTSSKFTTSIESDSSNIIRKINNRTYHKWPPSRPSTGTNIGDANENRLEYSLSMTAIAEALNKIECGTTGSDVMEQLLSKKSTTGEKWQPPKVQHKSLAESPKRQNYEFMAANNPRRESQVKANNKENVNPNKNPQLSETASFSESIFDCSEIKTPEGSNRAWRNSTKCERNLKPTVELNKFPRNQDNCKRRSKSPTSLSDMPPIEIIDLEKLTQEDDNKNHFKPIPAKRSGKSQQKVDLPVRSKSPNLQVAQKDSRKRPYASLNRPSSPHLQEIHEATKFGSLSPAPTIDQNISPNSSSHCFAQNLSPRDKNCISPIFNNSSEYERRFVIESSPDSGCKCSLPAYGLVSRSPSSILPTSKSPVTRCISQCSTSSEFSHHDGKMPLKSTCQEVSWGSIKLRKSVKKTLQIKNSSMKRLVVKGVVDGPGFQILNHEGGNLITLHPQECRTIVLSFCPTVIGPAVGKLDFRPPDRDVSSRNHPSILLYGYGGHANIIPHGTFKAPTGSAFITMGELRQLSSPLVKTFTMHNKGPLSGFVVVLIDSIGLDVPRLRDCVSVIPAKALIRPEETVKFQITFKPRHDDMKKIIKKISNVMILANLRLITGDEPTRQRIRNLIRKMNDSEKSKVSCDSLEKVWNAFSNESDIFELSTLKEHSDVAAELVSTFRIHEIALTLNHSVMDDTADNNLIFSDADETILFKTIIGHPTHTNGKSEKGSKSDLGQDGSREREADTWSVRPNMLEIDPFGNKKTSVLTVHSYFSSPQYFEVASNFKHLFLFSPSEGQIPPGESVEISVSYFFPSFLPTEQINVVIYIENGKITVPVNIVTHHAPPQFR